MTAAGSSGRERHYAAPTFFFPARIALYASSF